MDSIEKLIHTINLDQDILPRLLVRHHRIGLIELKNIKIYSGSEIEDIIRSGYNSLIVMTTKELYKKRSKRITSEYSDNVEVKKYPKSFKYINNLNPRLAERSWSDFGYNTQIEDLNYKSIKYKNIGFIVKYKDDIYENLNISSLLIVLK